MKETAKKIGALSLKGQMNRNQQKKIVGGASSVTCQNGFGFYWWGSCPCGYCEATGRGRTLCC